MARRQFNPSRRFGATQLSASLESKSRSSRYLFYCLVILGALLFIGCSYRGSGGFGGNKLSAVNRGEGEFLCTSEVSNVNPLLKKAYGDSMNKILHVGPDSCSVIYEIYKGGGEGWGVEPYDIEDADSKCKILVRKGIVRVADIKFPLPYRPKSFSLVIVSDALDYLSPKYLNKTLPDLARVAADGLVIFTGYPGHQRAKVADISKFGRPAKMRSSSWWIRYFVQTSLEENEVAMKKFDHASVKSSYNPNCQIFHLKPYH